MGFRLCAYIGEYSDWTPAFILRRLTDNSPLLDIDGRGWALFNSVQAAVQHVRKYSGWIEWDVSRTFPLS